MDYDPSYDFPLQSLHPAQWCAVRDNIHDLKYLIERGYFRDLELADPKTKKTLLHFAAEYGSVRVVNYLVDNVQSNINAVDSEQQTPLHKGIVKVTQKISDRRFFTKTKLRI